MIPRGTVIAALVVFEIAIIGMALVAVRGQYAWSPLGSAPAGAAIPRLVEGGPHRVFPTGAHPSLTVDIGYADLTIRSAAVSKIDVSVSPSSSFGIFRNTEPITAAADGDAVRVWTPQQRWSMGDNRMVTVVVPPDTHVTVVDAGDIRAHGLRGETSINSVGNGSVTIEDYASPTLRVSSSHGAMLFQGVAAARLDAKSRDGDIQASALQVRDGTVESNGDVTLDFAPGTDSLVTARTHNGNLKVAGATDAGASSQSVRVGAGSGHLEVSSNDGDITLQSS